MPLREEKNINFYVKIKIKLLDTHSWWIDIMWCKFNEKSHGFLDYFKDFVRNLEYSYGYHRVENRHSLIVLIVLSIKPWIKHNSTFWTSWTAKTAIFIQKFWFHIKIFVVTNYLNKWSYVLDILPIIFMSISNQLHIIAFHKIRIFWSESVFGECEISSPWCHKCRIL